jgi:hypothetical protein
MLFWGLASRELDEAIELYTTREAAEQALIDVLADEPTWQHLLFVTRVELAARGNSASPNLTRWAGRAGGGCSRARTSVR